MAHPKLPVPKQSAAHSRRVVRLVQAARQAPEVPRQLAGVLQRVAHQAPAVRRQLAVVLQPAALLALEGRQELEARSSRAVHPQLAESLQ